MGRVTEAELAAAWAVGDPVDAGDRSGDGGEIEVPRSIDARLIRRFCLQRRDDVDPHGVHIRNAHLTGVVDLAGVQLPFPVVFDGCTFEAAPMLDGANLHALVITRSPRLPGLLGNGLRVRRDLDLSHSRITGSHRTTASTSKRAAVWLCEAVIGGRLLCLGTVIEAEAERAIQADRIQVGGNVRLLRGFTATGEIRLIGARIGGSLDLTGVSLTSPGPALDLGEATIEASLFLIEDDTGRQSAIHGRIDLGSARIGSQLLIRNAACVEPTRTPDIAGYTVARGPGTAINAARLQVDGALSLEGESSVAGGVDLSSAELSRVTIGPRCLLDAPGRIALDLANARLSASLRLAEGMRARGTIQLRGARIDGNLFLDGVKLTEPQGKSLLAAHTLTVAGDVNLRRLHAIGGQLRFWRASVQGGLDAAGARLDNPSWHTLSLHQAAVGGSVRLVDDFHSTGFVMLNRVVIDGRLDCGGGIFDCPGPSRDNPGGYAIQAVAATVRGGIDLGWRSVDPGVNFTNTTTTVLADDSDRWPARFLVSGLTYQRLARPRQLPEGPVWDWRQRVAWLRRQDGYDAGPYEQAARVFREHGYTSEAEQILIAQRRHRRQVGPRQSLPRRLLDLLYGAAVGYGYRPGRALWALLTLLTLVGLSVAFDPGRATLRATDTTGTVYTTHGPLTPAGATTTEPCGGGRIRCFNPVFYAVDTVIPLISLDQRTTWHPDRHTPHGPLIEWWLNLATLTGWLLSSIVVLAFTKLARSG